MLRVLSIRGPPQAAGRYLTYYGQGVFTARFVLAPMVYSDGLYLIEFSEEDDPALNANSRLYLAVAGRGAGFSASSLGLAASAVSAAEQPGAFKPPVMVIKPLDSLPLNLEERLTIKVNIRGRLIEFLVLSKYLSKQESERMRELISASFDSLDREEVMDCPAGGGERIFTLILHNRIGGLFEVKDGDLYVSYRAVRVPPCLEDTTAYEKALPLALGILLGQELVLLLPGYKGKEIYSRDFYARLKDKSNRLTRDSLDYILSANIVNDLMSISGDLIIFLPVTFECLRSKGKAGLRERLKRYFAVFEGRWPIAFNRRQLETTKAQFILEHYINGYVSGGYFGAKRPDIEQKLNSWFGSDGWMVKHLIGGQFVSEEAALQHYEDGYFIYFRDNPDILEALLESASDVYDTAPSNIESGTDYNIQETPNAGRHLQDIAIRRAMGRLGREFRGRELMQIRGKKTKGYHLNPGFIPFHKPELITIAIKGWWSPGSIEAFLQGTKVIVLADKVKERIFEERRWLDASELAFILFEKIAFLVFNEELCIDTIDTLFWSLEVPQIPAGLNTKAREFSEHEIHKVINELIYLYEFACEIAKGRLNKEFLSMAKDWYGKITNPSTNEMYMTLSKAHIMFIPYIFDILRHSGAFPIFLIRDALAMYEFKKYESIVKGECFEAATLYQPGAPSRNTNKNKRSKDPELDEVTFRIEELMLNIKERLVKDNIISQVISVNTTAINGGMVFDILKNRFYQGVVELIENNQRFRDYSHNLYRRFKRIPLNRRHITIVDSFGSGKTALYVKNVIEYFAAKEGNGFMVDILLGSGMDKSLDVPNIADILNIKEETFPDLRWPFYFDRINYFVNQPVFTADKNIVYYLLLIYRSLLLYNAALSDSRGEFDSGNTKESMRNYLSALKVNISLVEGSGSGHSSSPADGSLPRYIRRNRLPINEIADGIKMEEIAVASALENEDRQARLRNYFREISKLYLGLIGELSLRMCSKIDKGLLEGADNKKGEIINRVNDLIQDNCLNQRVKDALKSALKQIEENKETAAQAVLLMILNILSFEIKISVNHQSQGHKVIWFDQRDLFWKLRQGQLINYELSGRGNVPMRASIPKKYKFFNDAFRSADHQIDNQLKEIVRINKVLKITAGNLSQNGIGELSVYLKKARVLEKDIAYCGICVLLGQIKIGDSQRAANTKYMVERLLEAHKSSLLEMINSVQAVRLKSLREVFNNLNKRLKAFIEETIGHLERSDKEAAWLNFRGFLANAMMSVT